MALPHVKDGRPLDPEDVFQFVQMARFEFERTGGTSIRFVRWCKPDYAPNWAYEVLDIAGNAITGTLGIRAFGGYARPSIPSDSPYGPQSEMERLENKYHLESLVEAGRELGFDLLLASTEVLVPLVTHHEIDRFQSILMTVMTEVGATGCTFYRIGKGGHFRWKAILTDAAGTTLGSPQHLFTWSKIDPWVDEYNYFMEVELAPLVDGVAARGVKVSILPGRISRVQEVGLFRPKTERDAQTLLTLFEQAIANHPHASQMVITRYRVLGVSRHAYELRDERGEVVRGSIPLERLNAKAHETSLLDECNIAFDLAGLLAPINRGESVIFRETEHLETTLSEDEWATATNFFKVLLRESGASGLVLVRSIHENDCFTALGYLEGKQTVSSTPMLLFMFMPDGPELEGFFFERIENYDWVPLVPGLIARGLNILVLENYADTSETERLPIEQEGDVAGRIFRAAIEATGADGIEILMHEQPHCDSGLYSFVLIDAHGHRMDQPKKIPLLAETFPDADLANRFLRPRWYGGSYDWEPTVAGLQARGFPVRLRVEEGAPPRNSGYGTTLFGL